MLFIGIFVISLSMFAQTATKPAVSSSLDPAAEKLLNDISKKYKTYKTSKIELDLTIIVPETKNNEVIPVKAWLDGNKFRVELEDQIFISDNKYIWNYMKSYNELQINNYDESDAMFSPSVIFTMYNDNFIYRTKEEYKNSAGKSIKVVELTPVDKTKDFFKIDLTINQTDMEILKSKIYEKSGIQYIYDIKKFTPNITLDSGFFTFKTENYKGVKVSDLR